MNSVKRFATIALALVIMGNSYLPKATAMRRKKQRSAKHTRKPSNKLDWAEVTKNKLSAQIMFGFAQPIYFKKKINKAKSQLLLQFPGMSKKFFNSNHVIKQISRLKASGLIKNIAISHKTGKQAHVSLTLTFHRNRMVTVGKKQHRKRNKLLIKWSKLDNPNRLIIDIFTSDTLDYIRQNNAVIQQARNTSSKPFFFGSKRGRKRYPRKPRVIIDAGHGGSDLGAAGANGIYEKDITLQIAKRVRTILRKNGISALLTRSTDDYVSPLTRSEIAEQMHADLFVSVHVNSHGNPKIDPCGIETLYLDDSKFIPSPISKNTGFWYFNTSPSSKMAQQARALLISNNQKSRMLASNLQTQMLKQLKKKSYTPTNRGLKKSREKVLIRSTIPAALVEVGFITNKQEIKNLTTPGYQQIVAHGIYSGIKNSLKFIR